MQSIIILSEKSWNQNLVKSLKQKNDKINWILINKKLDFNIKKLDVINPFKIFIPHWSYIIPEEIFQKYECVVFHMTDLPYGRGGSPLQNLISRGIDSTKISALKVEKGIDSGDIYLKENLELKGNANEIFIRANKIIQKMIISIIQKKIEPIPQTGKITEFKRRKPHESNIEKLETLSKVYDYIRMLDADGYPKAYLENNFLKFEFNDAKFKNKNEITATVKIKIKTKKDEK
jgi:methionyl-tRNA formyltransferase